ncbi:MAG: RluA family pseudouridine synthase [Alphaproteobacteria bacterium]|nr:RluA family pseudouridine synthase [Alphaproteobacteria bacterium]
MSRVDNRTVDDDEAGMRLDRWFRSHFPALGHGQLQKLLRKGQIRLDGKRAKANDRIEAGQSIRVPPLTDEAMQPRQRANSARPGVSDEDLEMLSGCILHRDESVIVLNKPPGLAVQGGSGTSRHLDGMLDALKSAKGERPRLVHRLDKDTSGVLILAATVKAARFLTAAFRTKDVRKLYWGLVAGVPEPLTGRIDLALSKSRVVDRSSGREQMIPDLEDGKRAMTLYAVQEHASRTLAWVAMEPLTGRTHQLRVHMAEIGTPIIGDGKYGGELAFPAIEGIDMSLHLHAVAVRFPHPGGGNLTVTAELPPHMQKSWKAFGFQASDHSYFDEWWAT